MPDATELTKAIKRAAQQAGMAGKPMEVCYGQVVRSAPLQILVEQKILLGREQLVLSRNVTDFTIEVTVEDWTTENRSGGSGDASFSSHNHAVTGKKKLTLHNGLVEGERVMLFRQQGGQKYIVWDRLE